jgi:hypothetical protein
MRTKGAILTRTRSAARRSGPASLEYGPTRGLHAAQFSNRVPPLKANPEIKAHLRDIRAALDEYRDVRPLKWTAAGVMVMVALAAIGVFYAPSLILALLALFYLLWSFFHERRRLRSLRMPCLHCEGHISLSDEWVCGRCSRTHRNPMGFRGHTWAEVCPGKYCGVPHSVICPDCREPIFFDDDGIEKYSDESAWLPGYPPSSKNPTLKNASRGT